MYGTVEVAECLTADDVRNRARINIEHRRQWQKITKPEKPLVIHSAEKVVSIVETPPIKTTTLEMLVKEAENLTYFGTTIEKAPSLRSIQKLTCRTFGIHLNDLLSNQRTFKVVLPRHVSFVLARALTGLSFPAIGRATGHRDHSAVLYAVRRHQWLFDKLQSELNWKNSVPEWVFRAHQLVTEKYSHKIARE